MGTKTSFGLVLALILVVLAMVLRFGIADKGKIEAAQKAAEQEASMNKRVQPKKSEKLQGSDNDIGASPHERHQHVDDLDVVNTDHLDQLSPEMKQAIRDKLLLHGPMEVIRHPDGSFELPSNGRFTQMPVAVQMPDGSIQIREYSQIPE